VLAVFSILFLFDLHHDQQDVLIIVSSDHLGRLDRLPQDGQWGKILGLRAWRLLQGFLFLCFSPHN